MGGGRGGGGGRGEEGEGGGKKRGRGEGRRGEEGVESNVPCSRTSILKLVRLGICGVK